MVSIAWPWILLLLPLPLLMRFVVSPPQRTGGVAVPPRLAEALDEVSLRASDRTGWGVLLPWAAWFLLLAAIAQPSIVQGQAVQPATGRAVMVALDLSSSMERKDFVVEGSKTDRLTALKSVAAAFIEKRAGDRIGLVLFGEEAFSAAPISYDLTAVANALREAEIGMAGRTTAIGEAIGLSIIKLRDDPASEKTILLLSDGTNNAGKAEPEDAAELARKLNIRIHSIGMGSEARDGDAMDASADLDEATLRRVSEISGGRFFRVRTTEELQGAYDEIDGIEASEANAPPFVPRVDLRNIALAGLVLVLALMTVLRRTGRLT